MTAGDFLSCEELDMRFIFILAITAFAAVAFLAAAGLIVIKAVFDKIMEEA